MKEISNFVVERTDLDSVRVLETNEIEQTLAIILNDGTIVYDMLTERIIDWPRTRVITGSILGKEVTLDRGDCRNTFKFSAIDANTRNVKEIANEIYTRICNIKEWERNNVLQSSFSVNLSLQ